MRCLTSRFATRTVALQLLLFACVSFSSVSLRAQSSESDVERILSAVVGVVAQIPATARTADVLGTERAGTGVVIDANGLVVTIGYLILEASRVEILLQDGHTIPAQVLGYDAYSGFGLLRARDAIAASPMALGQSASVKTRDPVLISSFGTPHAVSPAVVVSRRDYAGYWEYLLENPIITSPPHPSFGGAALIDPSGELLGVGSLALGDVVFGNQRLPGNMFLPIDDLKPILADLLTEGRSSAPARPWLGVYLREVQGRVIVVRIAEESPASAAGVAPGDVIVSIAGAPVSSLSGLYRALWSQGEAGVSVSLEILRESETLEILVGTVDRYSWYRN